MIVVLVDSRLNRVLFILYLLIIHFSFIYLPNQKFDLPGGNNGEHSLRSSDFVTLDGRMEGPKLPNKLHGHCMLTHHNGKYNGFFYKKKNLDRSINVHTLFS